MTSSTFAVSGMTCGHCAQTVTQELSLLDGVGDVAVDLAAGKVVVSSVRALSDSEVRTAIEEAGFHLVG